MKLSEITNFKDCIRKIQFKLIGTEKIESDSDTESQAIRHSNYFMTFDGNYYSMTIENKIFRFDLQNENSELSLFFKRKCIIVAEIEYFSHPTYVMNIYPFYSITQFDMTTYIGVKDKVKEKLRKVGIRCIYNKKDNELNSRGLSRYFSFLINNESYFLFKAPDEDDFNYVDPTEKDEKNDDIQSNTNKSDELEIPDFLKDFQIKEKTVSKVIDEQKKALTVIGNGIHLPIIIEENNYINASKLQVKQAIIKNFETPERFGLANGKIEFIDDSEDFRIPRLAEQAVQNLDKSKNSYLSNWDKYGNVEMMQFIKNSMSFGVASIEEIDQVLRGYQLTLSADVDLSVCGDGDEILISNSEPTFIKNGDISSTHDFVENFRSWQLSNSCTSVKLKITNNKIKKSRIIEIETEDGIVIKKNQFVFLSINGNLTQYKRRENAKNLIATGNCGNPVLALLLKESDDIDNILKDRAKNYKKINPLSDRIKSKIFSKNPPTATQIKAIEIALNTPDIAIIQGPPGTGKTTVITAIIERINELSTKENGIKGEVLVSGFQHDAVENIIERLSINSLPAIKFGEKRNGENSTTHRIENWALDIANKIRNNTPNIIESEQEIEWNNVFDDYCISPTPENEEKLLVSIINSNNSKVKIDTIIEDAKILLRRVKASISEVDNILLCAINSIRTKKNSFLDDGIENCLKVSSLSEDYDDLLTQQEKDFLEKSPNLDGSELDDYLTKLTGLKNKLLLQIIKKPTFYNDKPKVDILEIGNGMSDLLRNVGVDNEENLILADFLNELECNPLGIKKAVEDYQLVYSATTQQSVASQLLRAKGDGDKCCKNPLYDTVIIDEAARAVPLDLLIPMAQAKRRIVLVGDHRQLPHIVDETIVQSIESNEEIPKDVFEISMFERLFHRLQKLELSDGIQRTITLDAQYRTHPILGKFCSKFFYESHDKSEAYTSPLGTEYFKHNLLLPNGIPSDTSFLWFNVPNFKSKLQKNNAGSSYREREASVCAQIINSWIKRKESEKLSFGIISFYKAQVDKIFYHLEQYGITEKNREGKYEIKKEFEYFPNGKERLRIGSVDAFQGMEFDVVILSIVRSMSKEDVDKIYNNSKNNPTQASKRIVGFLQMENRLCVSMSRQKKLLCVVGDKDFISNQCCKEYVNSLYRFYKLCEDQGCVIDA